MFSDLFAQVGRRSVPPSVVAVVMVLQRLEGLAEGRRLGCWPGGFAHTVLGRHA